MGNQWTLYKEWTVRVQFQKRPCLENPKTLKWTFQPIEHVKIIFRERKNKEQRSVNNYFNCESSIKRITEAY
jgi:hypothetical protein